MKAKLIAIIILSNIISAGFVSADSHGEAPTVEEELEQATRQWNQAANRGEWENYFSNYALGTTQFFVSGMLRDGVVNTEEQREARIASYTEWNKNGGDRGLRLRDVIAKVHGDTAVVTAYRWGWFQWPEEDRVQVLEKMSVVWNKSKDGWKIVHVHISNLQADSD